LSLGALVILWCVWPRVFPPLGRLGTVVHLDLTSLSLGERDVVVSAAVLLAVAALAALWFAWPLASLDRYRAIMALSGVITLWFVWPPELASGEAMFVSVDQLRSILFERAIFGLLAAGMTVVILSAGIDLSVGSVLGMCATLFAIFLIWWEWPAPVAVLATMAIGAATGAVNGTLVARFRIQPFAATLAMMVFARGIARLVSSNQKVQTAVNPPIFEALTDRLLPWLPQTLSLLFLLCFAVLFVAERYTRFGRHVFAIGGNQEAARLSGIRVGWNLLAAYALCGLTSAVAGICNAARQTMGDPSAGATYELDAIAAVVIGGTSLMGGRGGILMTFVGVLIIGVIDKLLSLHGWDVSMRLMAKGVIIVLAVVIQGKSR